MSTESTERPAARRIGRPIAIFALVLLGTAILWCTYRSGQALAWGAVRAVLGLLVVLLLWCMWIALASHLCLRQARGFAKVAARLLLCVMIAAGSLLGLGTLMKQVATITRNREIRQAIDQGLYADCIALLDHWPSKHSRIFLGDVPLPRSIVEFHPAYITNDAIDYPGLGPPNIGLCKNGFGGFAEGIRIFRSDEDAQKCIAARGAFVQRIAPGIYYWCEST